MLQSLSPKDTRPVTERYLALHTGTHFLLLRSGALRELLRRYWPHQYGTELDNEKLENTVRLVGERTVYDYFPHLTDQKDIIAFESDERHTNRYTAPANISLVIFGDTFYVEALIEGYATDLWYASPRIPFNRL